MRLLLILVLASSCASHWAWQREDATQQDFRRDSYDCERDMRQSGYYGNGLIGMANARDFFDSCMYAHGWWKQATQ
jgi:hypothetical protein